MSVAGTRQLLLDFDQKDPTDSVISPVIGVFDVSVESKMGIVSLVRGTPKLAAMAVVPKKRLVERHRVNIRPLGGRVTLHSVAAVTISSKPISPISMRRRARFRFGASAI
ncbi:MAG: hypothetical protein AAFP90_05900 [Planctomycetota bacterium]